MKKLLLTVLLFAFALVGFSQTYYYVGGTSPTTFTNNSNWNTALDGSGSLRTVSPATTLNTEILIVDGSNIGGATPTTGAISTVTGGTSFGQLILKNNANVSIAKSTAGTTSTYSVTGDGTATDDIQIPAGCLLTLTPFTGDASGSLVLSLTSTATAKISGNFTLNGGGCRLVSATASAVSFESGSICSVNTVLVSQYPFTNVNSKQVIFKSGSKLKFLGGNSFFGNTFGNEPVIFQTGSIVEFSSSVPTTNSTAVNFFNGRTYSDVIISGNATVASDAFNKIDNLTIGAGSAFNLKTSSSSPVYGNIVNAGTLGVDGTPTTSQLLMLGSTAQTISGAGTFPIGNFQIGTNSNVTVLSSMSLNGTSTSSILGVLNLGTSNSIGGSGNIQFRPAATLNDANGSTTSGSNTLTMTDATTYGNLNPTTGLLVTGTGIPTSSYIIGTNSGAFSFTISNLATVTASGVSITTTGGTATLATSNTGGPDAGITTSGTKTFATGTHLILNGATNAPFPTFSTNDIGNLTINAASTTNRNATVTGNVVLGSAKLTVSESNNLTVSPTTTFSGMSSTAYIVTSANTGTGAVGTVKVVGLSASKMFPIGSTANYLPVTLAPVNSSDFTINAFQGATANATPNGTAFTAGQKADAVDAIWNVNRTTGTGNCTVSLAWSDALEGANFSSAMAGLGISQYTTSYSSFSGTASSSINTASVTATNDALGSFLVGKTTTLPVKLINFTAKAVSQISVLNWETTSEVNLSKYEVQRSADGVTFETLGSVKANNASGVFNYSFIDKSPAFGANYYRLLSIDLDGTYAISNIQAVNFGAVATLSVYPNPTKGEINIAGLIKGDLITITDMIGRTVQSQLYIGENVMRLNLDQFNTGVYLLSVYRNGQITSSNRIVKN